VAPIVRALVPLLVALAASSCKEIETERLENELGGIPHRQHGGKTSPAVTVE
jgi:hypothetical protein